MNKKNIPGQQNAQTTQNQITISVTKLCWAVSKVMNFVNKTKKSVVVTNRNTAIALIVPISDQEPDLNLYISGQFELEVEK